MVGRDQCVVRTTSDTTITCIAPPRDEPVVENVIVSGDMLTIPTTHYCILFSGVIWTEYQQQCGSA